MWKRTIASPSSLLSPCSSQKKKKDRCFVSAWNWNFSLCRGNDIQLLFIVQRLTIAQRPYGAHRALFCSSTIDLTMLEKGSATCFAGSETLLMLHERQQRNRTNSKLHSASARIIFQFLQAICSSLLTFINCLLSLLISNFAAAFKSPSGH